MPKPLKVLLVSPVRGHDVFCGDVIYTELLEKYPPENITYINYVTALQKGLILERKRLRALPRLFKENIFLFLIDLLPAILISFLNIFRRANLLIANPWKFLYLKEKFDLVHCHVFPLSLSGRPAPLIISNAVTSPLFLRNVRGLPAWLVGLISWQEIVLTKLFNVQESSLTVKPSSGLILFSKRLAHEYKYVPQKNIHIIPIGLPGLLRPKTKKDPSVFHLGFIAKDFETKGGPELLAAYQGLKKIYGKKLKLSIIGSPSRLEQTECKKLDINWQPLVKREVLLKKLAPEFDLFIYPTRSDGFPLVILEMLALGIPCVVSDFFALPEMIENDQAGAVCHGRDTESLQQTIKKLLVHSKLTTLSKKAKELFERKYNIKITGNLLRQAYIKTIEEHKTSKW